MSLFKMASFRQLSHASCCLVRYSNENIENRLRECTLQEKKRMGQVIMLILGDHCPKHLRLHFFGSTEEKDTKLKERNQQIKKILQDIHAQCENVVQNAFQQSEAFWHPIGCQCQDDDCLRGNFRGLLHPDNCQCTGCRVLSLLACCCECLVAFNNN
jgi:hypothetical protein